MSNSLEAAIDTILSGASGEKLVSLLSSIRTSESQRARFTAEVALRNQVAQISEPLVIDVFLVDDFYCGRLAGLIALQVARVLLEDETLWKQFLAMHDAHRFADTFEEGDDFDDLLNEERQEYNTLVDLSEFSSSPSTHALRPTAPESTHTLITPEREQYLGGEQPSSYEKISYTSRQHHISIIWLPGKQDLRFSVSPPLCDEATFMGGTIILRHDDNETQPHRRDYSSIVANALFVEIAHPWGAKLSVSRDILPNF